MVQVQDVNYGNITQTGGLADAFGKGRTRRAARKAAQSKEARLGRQEQRDIVKGENVERRAQEKWDYDKAGQDLANSTEAEQARLRSLVDYAEVLQDVEDEDFVTRSYTTQGKEIKGLKSFDSEPLLKAIEEEGYNIFLAED